MRPRARRLGGRGAVGRGEVDLRNIEPRLQVDEEARRRLLADSRHETQRIGVVGRHGTSEVGRRVHRDDREREGGADAVSAEQRLEARPFVARREAVQRARVFADVVVDVEEDFGARLARRRERAGRHR